jgi:putative membrane-bound dehydrogenase-like protein
MKFPKGSWWWISLVLLRPLLTSLAAPSEPEVDAKDMPRVPPTEPGHALETFQIKPGFRIELVASEPLVMDPIALSFDEQGRLYVVEMRDYSERRDEHLGRIRLLEDTDGDGRFDKSTVFADNLAWPTAILCYDGGVFVGATPDIFYLKDTNSDGVADIREVAFTGFGAGVARLNVQQLFNSFSWGPDNRIYGADGGNGGSITSPKRPNDPPLQLRNRDYSFDPRTREMRAESGGGQYGMSFDDRGHRFVCSNSSHIRAVMYDERYAGRNRFFTLPPSSADIAVDGPAAEVYRISPDEPWRVLRTRWRVAGLVPGPIEGGGRPSGYFTGATGITIYRGNAWPDEYRGDAFTADCGSNLVHRKKVYPDGIGLKAERPATEKTVEFLASRDNWFRPVQMANAPDGTLYVIDMYREVIEHPWSLPQSLKKHLDLNSGNDRGRIYRIVPDGFKQPALPRLGLASMGELVATLEHPNGWHQDTASRLLYERQDAAAVPQLHQLLAHSKSSSARVRALYALTTLHGLNDRDLFAALKDQEAVVREHALRLAEDFWSSQVPPPAWIERLETMTNDPDPQVRYQLALSLVAFDLPNRASILESLIQRDPADSWMQMAVLNSTQEDAIGLFLRLIRDRAFATMRVAEPFLRQLATIIGARNQRSELDTAVDALNQTHSTPLACGLAGSLGAGLEQGGNDLVHSVGTTSLSRLFTNAKDLLAGDQAPTSARLDAVRLLGHAPFDQVHSILRSLFAQGQSPELARASVRALAGFNEPEITQDLLQAWPGFTPSLRSDVIDALLRRADRVSNLLDALQSGTLRRADLSANQIDTLRKYSDSLLRERAIKLLGQTAPGGREQLIKAYSDALTLAGQKEHGQEIYLQRCSSCHRLAGQGYSLGPDLETVRANGKESLLTNLLDPNREVMPKYVNYLAATQDGEIITGLVATENETSVVLRQPNGNESTLLRANIHEFRSLGQSAMPEGLEEGLSHQDVADLMEYVLTAKAP